MNALVTSPGPAIDLEPLLAPIPGDAPVGVSLRYEGTWDQISDARREDDATLPTGVWKAPLKRADWRKVAQLCQEALATRSKDLQLAAWLLEAWVEQHGFAGLELGLRLLTGLAERYWDGLFPALEADDPAGRLAPLAWIDDRVTLKLKRLPITRPEGADATAYTYGEWEAAVFREKVGGGKSAPTKPTAAAGDAPGLVTQARFMTAVSLTAPAFFVALTRSAQASLAAAAALEKRFGEGVGRAVTPLRQVKQLLNDVLGLLSQQRGGPAVEATTSGVSAAPVEAESGPGETQVDTSRPMDSGPIRSRADAYRRLIEVADYLLRTEPHSPTPYLLKRAISWGEKPLDKLLEEIVATPADLKTIFTLLGMAGPPK